MAAYTVSTGWKPVDRAGLNQEIGTTSTVQKHVLGERVVCKDTSSSDYGFGEFIYLKGVANVVAGTPCLITDTFGTSTIAARDKGAHAIATAAIVANNYGWFQIKGKAMTAVGTIVANAPLYIAAAGALYDDLAVAGDQVIGARSVTATDTATAIVNFGCNPATADFDNA